MIYNTETCLFNLFTPKLQKSTLQALNLDTSIVVNLGSLQAVSSVSTMFEKVSVLVSRNEDERVNVLPM